MCISDWSSDVCSSDLHLVGDQRGHAGQVAGLQLLVDARRRALEAEIVELERVVLGRSVEGDLEPGALDKRRPLLGRVSRYGEHRDDEVDVVERAAQSGRAAGRERV